MSQCNKNEESFCIYCIWPNFLSEKFGWGNAQFLQTFGRNWNEFQQNFHTRYFTVFGHRVMHEESCFTADTVWKNFIISYLHLKTQKHSVSIDLFCCDFSFYDDFITICLCSSFNIKNRNVGLSKTFCTFFPCSRNILYIII